MVRSCFKGKGDILDDTFPERGWKSLFRSRRHAEMDPDQNASVCFFCYRCDRKEEGEKTWRREMDGERSL